jgi:hypothetical protein
MTVDFQRVWSRGAPAKCHFILFQIDLTTNPAVKLSNLKADRERKSKGPTAISKTIGPFFACVTGEGHRL